ncbi:MAG: hypothetical protein JSV19_05200 [Phycisphaerales bacterium]|nr:MAG: hypothetical protein JSV19_05200 [Phycisphaerales bacterium]
MRAISVTIVALLVQTGLVGVTHASPPLKPTLLRQSDLLQGDEQVLPADFSGTVAFSVTIDDPALQYAGYHEDVERLALAASAEWGQYLGGQAVVELRIAFVDGDYLMASRPMVAVDTGEAFDGIDVYQAGPIWELRGHADPNGQEADGEILIAPSALGLMFWGYPQDPHPHRYDAYETILHELGHILGFACSDDYYAGTATWMTTYDTHVVETATGYGYGGPMTVEVFDGPVPLSDATSPGVYVHTDVATGPGRLMYPYTDFGSRLSVTEVELAILTDAGMPVQEPCLDASADWTLDSDEDTVPDCADNCPNTPNQDRADADGDGVGDVCDTCPDDPNKWDDEGLCGCGLADVDTDEDGSLDCDETCPNDPDKTEPGFCGCGAADTDSDSDETPDCQDQCPDDPDKTLAGACGCGVPDADSDGDGIADCEGDDSQEFLDIDEGDETEPIDTGPADGTTAGGSAGGSAACGVGIVPLLPLMLATPTFVRLSRRRSSGWARR